MLQRLAWNLLVRRHFASMKIVSAQFSQEKNLPINVSAKCEDLHTEINHDSSKFQMVNINFGPLLPAAGRNEASRKYLR